MSCLLYSVEAPCGVRLQDSPDIMYGKVKLPFFFGAYYSSVGSTFASRLEIP